MYPAQHPALAKSPSRRRGRARQCRDCFQLLRGSSPKPPQFSCSAPTSPRWRAPFLKQPFGEANPEAAVLAVVLMGRWGGGSLGAGLTFGAREMMLS